MKKKYRILNPTEKIKDGDFYFNRHIKSLPNDFKVNNFITGQTWIGKNAERLFAFGFKAGRLNKIDYNVII